MNLYEAIERFINDNSYIPMKKKDLFFMMDEEGSADVHAFDKRWNSWPPTLKFLSAKRERFCRPKRRGL